MDVLLCLRHSGARKALRERLERRGCRVVHCDPPPATTEGDTVGPPGDAILEACADARYRLAFLEVACEGEQRLVRELRALLGPGCLLTLVVAQTGGSTAPSFPGQVPLSDLLDHGADDFLMPPWEPPLLDARLAVLEQRSEQRRSAAWTTKPNFQQLVETMNEGLGVRDENGVILYANPHLAAMLGYEPEDLVGRRVEDLIPAEARPRFRDQVRERGKGTSSAYELVMEARDGRRVDTLQSARPLTDAAGSVAGSFAVITDITERKQVERRLRLTQFTVDHAADAVFWIGEDARFLYVNHTACDSLGYSREELLQMTVPEIDPDFPEEVWKETWPQVREGKSFTRQSRHRRKDGTVFPVELRVNYLQYGGQEYHVAVARDITERKEAEERLRHSAFHDTLTGLANRALFMDRLQHCMDLHGQDGRGFAVLFLDLDRFKVVNDSLGHVVGDQLLTAIARRLETAVGPADTVARIGGDEFLVLVEGADSEAEVIRLADHIQEEIQRAFHIQSQELFTSASIGIALGEDRYQWAVDILRDADIAMYRSKGRGGGCATIFDQDMHRRAVSRLQLETDLRRALHREHFRLVYQPIVDLQDGTLEGWETLLRWRHPLRGRLEPVDFIETAEEMDLIVPLSWWVFDAACRELRQVLDEADEDPELRLSLNVSGRLVGHVELRERLLGTLETHSIEPRHISLEITESVILEHPERAERTLTELADLGFEIAIDDFGAGYSSLRYLSRLPVGLVKIDRSFISCILEEPKALEITRSVVDLVHNLGMRAVAEGVEQPAQLELLRGMGCDQVQGYLVGRPVNSREMHAQLRRKGSYLQDLVS